MLIPQELIEGIRLRRGREGHRPYRWTRRTAISPSSRRSVHARRVVAVGMSMSNPTGPDSNPPAAASDETVSDEAHPL
jgi:hypothetical protein